MILGIGTDIIEIDRIQESIDRVGERFVKRILTESEQVQYNTLAQDRRASFLAKRFAAKEAAVKALGTGIGRGVSFQHFTVKNLPSGQPTLEVDATIESRFEGAIQWHLSLSDERQFALAFVTLEAKG